MRHLVGQCALFTPDFSGIAYDARYKFCIVLVQKIQNLLSGGALSVLNLKLYFLKIMYKNCIQFVFWPVCEVPLQLIKMGAQSA